MNEIDMIVPEEIDGLVELFCPKIVSSQRSVFVPVLPESYSLPNHCFPNVEEKSRKDGGSIEYGWQIWMWPKVFIEAEFHAVWKSPEESLIDITPKVPPYEKTLFLSDKKKEYRGQQIDNIRKNISNNQLVDLYINVFECIFLIKNAGSRSTQNEVALSGGELELFRFLSEAGLTLQNMLKQGISRNDNCFCGSGQNLKTAVGENC